MWVSYPFSIFCSLIDGPEDESSCLPSPDGTMRRHLAIHPRRNPRSRKLRRHRVGRADPQAGRVCSDPLSFQRVIHGVQNRAFTNVRMLMQKQVDRPFIKRYLKRDDILQAIRVCDTELNNALSLFGVCFLSLLRVSPDNYFLWYSFPFKSVSCVRSRTRTGSGEQRWRPSSPQ